MYAPWLMWFRRIRRMSRERSNDERVLFTLIAPIKVTNPHGTPKLSPLARCPGQYPNIPTSFTRRSLCRVEGPFPLGPNIIDKRLFPPFSPTLRGHADDGDTLYVLNAGRLDMRNICDWRAICLSGVAAVRKKSRD